MDEQQFRLRCDEAMGDLYKALVKAADKHELEVDENAGALTVEFEDPPAKFVVSPNAPVRQIWVSALTRSFKLDWNAERAAFVLPESGATLKEMMGTVIGTQLGETVQL
ncbi:MAG: iron donor protein CyaY [Bryobacterales bacterium]|nr:iron donor protein CyaY [Bryobacterales bacterium]